MGAFLGVTVWFCPHSSYWRIANLVHNRPMIWSAGDLSIEIDFGSDQPGAILQRKDKGYWHDYLVKGEPVVKPFNVEMLVSGWYQLREQ